MATTKWAIDPTHSEIGFKVKHMMFTNVSGKFDQYDGSIETEENDFTTAKIAFSAAIDSIDTRNSDRDNHLKSADFFDVAKAPTAKFVITKVEPYTATAEASLIADPNYLISGNLTLKDKTLNVTFPAKVLVTSDVVTASAKFVIDRSAWGINYKTEGSAENWMISKDVEIGLTLNAKK